MMDFCKCKDCTTFDCDDCPTCDICMVTTGCISENEEETTGEKQKV